MEAIPTFSALKEEDQRLAWSLRIDNLPGPRTTFTLTDWEKEADKHQDIIQEALEQRGREKTRNDLIHAIAFAITMPACLYQAGAAIFLSPASGIFGTITLLFLGIAILITLPGLLRTVVTYWVFRHPRAVHMRKSVRRESYEVLFLDLLKSDLLTVLLSDNFLEGIQARRKRLRKMVYAITGIVLFLVAVGAWTLVMRDTLSDQIACILMMAALPWTGPYQYFTMFKSADLEYQDQLWIRAHQLPQAPQPNPLSEDSSQTAQKA